MNATHSIKRVQRKKYTPNVDIHRIEFEQIREESALPDLDGLGGAVIDRLVQRLGDGYFDIEDIAMDLRLNKRTLQRHLDKEGVKYADLYDKVRYNIAIDCMLNERMSVEQTAIYLGFTDRTSLTTAFKRWSGMCPRVFSNTYRYYYAPIPD